MCAVSGCGCAFKVGVRMIRVVILYIYDVVIMLYANIDNNESIFVQYDDT